MGPYDLNEKATDSLFTEDGIIGNYAYGEIAPTDGAFIVKYVGPSDGDLRNHIKHGIGQYSKFKYSLANNVKEAFEKECKNYHDFSPSGNSIHLDCPTR